MTSSPLWCHDHTPMTSSKIFEIWLTGHMTFCCTLIGPFVPRDLYPALWLVCTVVSPFTTNIKVFILFRFTEFDKMLPFYKNISVFVYRSRQSDESIEMWVRVKMWSCCALNLCSSLRRTHHGLILWILMVTFFFFIKSCKVQLNILFVGLFFSGKSV